MAGELVTAQRWLRGQLVNSPILFSTPGTQKIFEFPAPQASVPPYIVIDYRGGKDQSQQLLRSTTRTATTLYFGVSVVGADGTVTTLSLVPIADAIDTALEGQVGQLDGLEIFGCRRDQPLMGASMESSDTRRFLGGLYVVSVRPARP